jgi:hypothetical protein
MALAVNQTEEKELNWADFIDGLRSGVTQRVAIKRGAQADREIVPASEDAAPDGAAPPVPPGSYPN